MSVSNPNWKPKLVAFCCNWCSYAGADLAGSGRMAYPADVKIIRVPCSCRAGGRDSAGADGAGACGTVHCCFERVGQTHPWEAPLRATGNPSSRKGAINGCGGGAVRGA